MNFIKNLINYSLIIIFSLFITKSLFAEEFGTKDEAAALLDRAIALVKVDKKMAALIDSEKRYKKHMQNKDATEKKLFLDMQKKAKDVSEHLTRVSNVRSWSKEASIIIVTNTKMRCRF